MEGRRRFVAPNGKAWSAQLFMLWAAGVRGDVGKKGYLDQLTIALLQLEVAKMADNGKSRVQAGERRDKEFKGFASLSLTMDRKAEFDQWEASWEDVIELTGQLVSNDYRVGFASANDGATVQVSVTCKDKRNSDFGWCMTSRAPDWISALRVAVWKHFVLCDQTWDEYKSGADGSDWA